MKTRSVHFIAALSSVLLLLFLMTAPAFIPTFEVKILHPGVIYTVDRFEGRYAHCVSEAFDISPYATRVAKARVDVEYLPKLSEKGVRFHVTKPIHSGALDSSEFLVVHK